MSAALKTIEKGPLRVALNASSPVRRTALRQLLVAAGHIVVEAHEAADIVLADGDYAVNDNKPTLVLGGGEHSGGGLLSADADADQIDAALRAVAAGLIVRAPAAERQGFAALDETDGDELLSPREVEVLYAIMNGLTNKAIARALDISLHTVKFHVESVFRKLGVRTRAEAVAKALHAKSLKMIKL